MDIIFTTREYEAEHGRKPRGYGYWWFSFEGFEFQAKGTLTEAKKACRRHIRSVVPREYREAVHVNVEP